MKALTLRPGLGKTIADDSANKTKDRRWMIIPFILASIPSCYFVFQNCQTHVQAPVHQQQGASISELTAEENLNPEKFVTGQVKMRRNFFNEIIVEGSLRNIARYTNYSDPVLHIDFLSKTGIILFSKDYEVKGVLRSNGFTDYKFTNPPSDDVYRISASIRSAEVCKR